MEIMGECTEIVQGGTMQKEAAHTKICTETALRTAWKILLVDEHDEQIRVAADNPTLGENQAAPLILSIHPCNKVGVYCIRCSHLRCSIAINLPRRPDESIMLPNEKREVDTTPAGATV